MASTFLSLAKVFDFYLSVYAPLGYWKLVVKREVRTLSRSAFVSIVALGEARTVSWASPKGSKAGVEKDCETLQSMGFGDIDIYLRLLKF
jgi:hypothetical protein